MTKRQSLSRRSVNLLRAGRNAVYVTLSPLEYLFRLVNGKGDLPPLYLRRHAGPLRSFEGSGAEFMEHLRLLVGLQPGESILDIGCGCGLMALYLQDYLSERGTYTGVDIHRPSMEWCVDHIGKQHPNFRFQHVDVQSLAYNPRGEHSGSSFTFPYDSHSFDVILLKSVFTHLRPPEVENYLREVARLLKQTGRCLATFFLLNEEQRTLAANGRNVLDFSRGDEQWRYVYEHSPESAAAYDEGYVLDLLKKYGLGLKQPILYGTWSGRENGLSFQDMLVISPLNQSHLPTR